MNSRIHPSYPMIPGNFPPKRGGANRWTMADLHRVGLGYRLQYYERIKTRLMMHGAADEVGALILDCGLRHAKPRHRGASIPSLFKCKLFV